jgi:predicted enzyme related to lactoylglutathione lyase
MSTNRNPVGWFEIYVQDMDRAKAFYEKTFAVTLQKLESPGVELWAFPMVDGGFGCAGALVKMDGKDSGIGGTIVYFPGEDCGAMAASAAKNGGRIQNDKKSIGDYGFIAHVLDPEGNLIGLHSMK